MLGWSCTIKTTIITSYLRLVERATSGPRGSRASLLAPELIGEERAVAEVGV
jgi:hypothetical protein